MDDRVMLGRGDRIAGYEVEAVIARGGMGVVYRAHQVGLGRSVALKVIAGDRAGDATFRARFVREARLAASLDHPNVIPVFEAGEDDRGELFIAMRLVDGSDLGRLIERSGPLDPQLACLIVGQAAAGLEAAHAAGLVHRDVKPANILLAGPPADPHVYVSDFGVAKSSTPAAQLTSASEWVGTPGYAAPEQIRGGEVDARADVYALGCVLLAALTRRAAAPRPPLSPALESIVDRATATSPSARFQSAGELAAALQTAGRQLAAAAQAAGETVANGGGRARAAGDTVGTGGVRAAGDAVRTGGGGAAGAAGVAGGTGAAGDTVGAGDTASAAAPGPTPTTQKQPVRTRRRPVSATSGAEDRRGWWPAAGFGLAFCLVVGVVVAVALTRGPSHHGPPAAARSGARAPAVPSTPVAAGGGDTVFCSASACTQSGGPVLVPIEGGSCVRDGMPGTWTRLDAGAPEPMLICLPGSRLPEAGVPVPVPTLTGSRLDHAEAALDQLGIRYKTSGGGLFGIIFASDWTVCATSPPAGSELPAQTEVTVFVEHGC